MKRSQWFVLAIVFWILMIFFVYQDFSAQKSCDILKTASEQPMWCINTEIYDPLIYLFATLGIAFLICGFLERNRKS